MSKVTKEQIDAFLSGSDPMERIIKIECEYDDDKVSIIYRDEQGKKRIKRDNFFPFIWCKETTAQNLFNGDRKQIRFNLSEYGIGVKSLRTTRDDGSEPERMKNGYKLMFYAKVPMAYSKFMDFFNKAGRPIYPKQRDKNNGLKEYIAVSPVEQYMIQTGRRMFKGYEDYDDLLRMEWDLETEGLDPQIHAISQIGIRTNKGYERIITITGEGEEKHKNELKAICEFFEIIKELQPDVITGHNTENFDWNFIDVRLGLFGFKMGDFSLKYFRKGVYKKKKQQVLKLGGEMEYYFPTVMWGTNLTDSLFAVRRAMAVNSNIKSANLKYITKFSDLNKKNRVYVPGKIINTTWEDLNPNYAFNDENGHWFKVDEKLLTKTTSDGQLRYIKYEEDGKQMLIDNENNEKFEFVTGRYIVQRYLLDDLWETDKVEYKYNVTNYFVCKMLPVSFEKTCTMGTAAIWKYIMLAWSYEQGLAIPELVNTHKFTGGLSRLLKTGKIKPQAKLDYNSLYPSIILTFGIKTQVDLQDTMSDLLEYLLTKREYYKGLKKQKEKESEKLEKEINNTQDKEEKNRLLEEKKKVDAEANLYDNTQGSTKLICNGFFGSYGSGNPFPHSDLECAEETTCTGRQALRLMIGHFSNLSKFNGSNLSKEYNYNPVVGDPDGFNFELPEKYRYTDEHPYISNGKGRNTKEGKTYTKVEADIAEFEDLYMCEAYNGGINKMGLGLDEYISSSVNLSRKNYLDLFPNGKLKFVGNSIKSKKMPIYIEKFLNDKARLLLEGKGKEFLEAYYDYVEKIFNLQIPIKDIATVGKIKTSIANYKENCKQLTAGGTKKARQAWYELAIKHNLNVNMGDSIYYINTGSKKGDSDVKRVTDYFAEINGQETNITKELERLYTKAKKDRPDEMKQPNGKWITKSDFGKIQYGHSFKEEDRLIFNCILLPNEIVEDEDDHFCDDNFEYNVDKYVEMFNKKIKPLLVCFSRDIRTKINEKGKEVSNILISNPDDRKQFTEEECQLVSGQPYNPTDQDTYEQLMTMEDKEIKFWTTVDKVPPYVNEIGMDWEKIKADYFERQKQLEKEEIQLELTMYNNAINQLTESEVDEFIEDGVIPDRILAIVDEDTDSNNFVSKKYNVVIGNIFDIIDHDCTINVEEIENDFPY